MPIFHLGSLRKTDPTKCQVSFGELRKKLFFGGLGEVRFIHFGGAKQSGKLPIILPTQETSSLSPSRSKDPFKRKTCSSLISLKILFQGPQSDSPARSGQGLHPPVPRPGTPPLGSQR